MPYNPTIVANNVLSRAFTENVAVSPMKLQKILYFAASEYQKKTQQPLFSERFQTWKYGPVIRTVYDEFRSFSRQWITSYAKDAEGQAYVINEDADQVLSEVLNSVWEATKGRSAVDLSEITHAEGSAWDRAFQVDQPMLAEDDIASDTTYADRLGLS